MHNMDTKGINSRYLDRDIATSIGKFFFDKSVNEKLKKEDFTLDTLKERCDLTTMTIDSFH